MEGGPVLRFLPRVCLAQTRSRDALHHYRKRADSFKSQMGRLQRERGYRPSGGAGCEKSPWGENHDRGRASFRYRRVQAIHSKKALTGWGTTIVEPLTWRNVSDGNLRDFIGTHEGRDVAGILKPHEPD